VAGCKKQAVPPLPSPPSQQVDIARPQTDYFTSLELADHRLFYTHDDSESRRDSFAFTATKHGGSGFQYRATFHIHVLLRHPPPHPRVMPGPGMTRHRLGPWTRSSTWWRAARGCSPTGTCSSSTWTSTPSRRTSSSSPAPLRTVSGRRLR
jgi:hypothetical protein